MPGTQQYGLFRVQFLPLGKTFVRFLHATACVRSESVISAQDKGVQGGPQRAVKFITFTGARFVRIPETG